MKVYREYPDIRSGIVKNEQLHQYLERSKWKENILTSSKMFEVPNVFRCIIFVFLIKNE